MLVLVAVVVVVLAILFTLRILAPSICFLFPCRIYIAAFHADIGGTATADRWVSRLEVSMRY